MSDNQTPMVPIEDADGQRNTPENPIAKESPPVTAKAAVPALAPGSNEKNEPSASPGGPIVLLLPERATLTAPSPEPTGTPTPPVLEQHVHIAPNVADLVKLPLETPEQKKAAQEQRDLNQVVHSLLLVGLVISTTLMLVGLALDLVLQRELPTTVPGLGDVLGRILTLRPSGFFALGLLVLIATPLLRVVGSIVAFASERDWRFAGITCLVLTIVLISVFLGRG